MVAISDSKSRSNAHKMPLSQHYNQNPISAKLPSQITNQYPVIKGGIPGSQPNSTHAGGPLPVTSQKIMIPDKNKYNFMGVSSIKQGQNQEKNGKNDGNEYGGNSPIKRPAPGTNPRNMVQQSQNSSKHQSPMKINEAPNQMYPNTSHNFQPQNPSNSQQINNQNGRNLAETDVNSLLQQSDSRKSNRRQPSGGNSEQMPVLQTLMSANTSNSITNKDQPSLNHPQSSKAPYPNNSMLILSMQKQNQRVVPGQSNYTSAQRSQNYDNEIQSSSQRQGQSMLSPQSSLQKPQFMLPQTKQLPQKEFVMMDVGTKGGPRKGSRNTDGKR